jgi:hypothetical protein
MYDFNSDRRKILMMKIATNIIGGVKNSKNGTLHRIYSRYPQSFFMANTNIF